MNVNEYKKVVEEFFAGNDITPKSKEFKLGVVEGLIWFDAKKQGAEPHPIKPSFKLRTAEFDAFIAGTEYAVELWVVLTSEPDFENMTVPLTIH